MNLLNLWRHLLDHRLRAWWSPNMHTCSWPRTGDSISISTPISNSQRARSLTRRDIPPIEPISTRPLLPSDQRAVHHSISVLWLQLLWCWLLEACRWLLWILIIHSLSGCRCHITSLWDWRRWRHLVHVHDLRWRWSHRWIGGLHRRCNWRLRSTRGRYPC